MDHGSVIGVQGCLRGRAYAGGQAAVAGRIGKKRAEVAVVARIEVSGVRPVALEQVVVSLRSVGDGCGRQFANGCRQAVRIATADHAQVDCRQRLGPAVGLAVANHNVGGQFGGGPHRADGQVGQYRVVRPAVPRFGLLGSDQDRRFVPYLVRHLQHAHQAAVVAEQVHVLRHCGQGAAHLPILQVVGAVGVVPAGILRRRGASPSSAVVPEDQGVALGRVGADGPIGEITQRVGIPHVDLADAGSPVQVWLVAEHDEPAPGVRPIVVQRAVACYPVELHNDVHVTV